MSEFYEFDPPKEGDEPQLPPLFNSQSVLKGQDPFDKAVSSANAGDVGTVFYSMDTRTECFIGKLPSCSANCPSSWLLSSWPSYRPKSKCL